MEQEEQTQINEEHDLLILYGSQTGNAHYLAEEIEREAIQRNFRCHLLSCDNYNIKNLPNEKYVILVISTTGQGDAPENMIKFWQFLLIKDLPTDSLKNINFTIFGLGDSNYQLFNAMARKVHRRLLDLGANQFVERGLGDDQHPMGYYSAFDIWMGELWEELHKRFPQKLQIKNDDNAMETEEQGENKQKSDNPPTSRFIIKYVQPDEAIQQEVLKSYQLLHQNSGLKNQYIPCTMVNKELLTPPAYERKTYKVDFDISGSNLKYNPGDILVVHPQNELKLCLDIAGLLKIDLAQVIEISVNPEHPSKFHNPFPQYIRIYDLFISWLNLQSAPNRYFLKLLSYYTKNDLHKERLLEMAARNVEGQEDYYEYVVRESRNVFEILFDFQSFDYFPLEYLLESVSLQMPRKYSISSSQLRTSNKVSKTIGLVKYKTDLKREITGICSKYIENLALNQRVLIQVLRGTLNFPKDLTTPVIMVGPGTGVAPFISFIEERVQLIENSILSNNKPDNLHHKTLLFFGCRHQKKDFYYGQQLELLHENNMISLFTAFSRDGQNKVYVQHQIEKNWELLFNIIQQNFETVKIFVAGTSKFMPQQVEEAFTNVIFKGNKQNDMEQAKNIINFLKKKKQYIVEAW